MAKDPNDNTPAGATALDYIHHIQVLVEIIDPDRLPDDACRKAISDLADIIDNARVVLGQASRKAPLLVNDPNDLPDVEDEEFKR